jgi:hypothetical protein
VIGTLVQSLNRSGPHSPGSQAEASKKPDRSLEGEIAKGMGDRQTDYPPFCECQCGPAAQRQQA